MKKVQERKVKLLIDFCQKEGRVPGVMEEYEGIKIGRFFERIKNGRAKLSSENMNLVKESDILEYPKFMDDMRHKKIMLIKKFYDEKGRLPKCKEKYEGQDIGYFYYRIKQNKQVISPEDIRLLEEWGIPSCKKTIEEKRDEKIDRLIEFYNDNNRFPKTTEVYKGVYLGSFVHYIRNNKIELTEKQKEKLKSAGLDFERKKNDINAENKIKLLIEYYNNTGKIPSVHEVYKGQRIGEFIARVRRGKVVLSEENWKLLNSSNISINLSSTKDRVHNKVLALIEFKEKFCRVPRYDEEYKGIKIAQFHQSIKRRHTSVSSEDEKLLFNVGIILKEKN